MVLAYQCLINLSVSSQRAISKCDVIEGGGRGYPKLVTKSDIEGRGVHANSDITTKNMYKFVFYVCFWSAQQQLRFG